MVINPTRPNGWLVIDKPLGFTSAQVVGKLKAALRRVGYPKNLKIGHGGTLDPLATGVLPIALGEATKLTGALLNGPKEYCFKVRFGMATSTDDAEGAAIAHTTNLPNAPAIEQALEHFKGQIWQKPPAYSALKVAGERAYALARAGRHVELAPRAVTIEKLVLKEFTPHEACFVVACSKGTYVRSLARDIAQSAGSLGYVSALHRTQAGPFSYTQAILLDFACEMVQQQQLEQIMLPLLAGLDDIPALVITPAQAVLLKQGCRLAGTQASPLLAIAKGRCLAMLESVPIALVDVAEDHIRVLRGFNCD
jgi:tRNA pseudouridine55 synthase